MATNWLVLVDSYLKYLRVHPTSSNSTDLQKWWQCYWRRTLPILVSPMHWLWAMLQHSCQMNFMNGAMHKGLHTSLEHLITLLHVQTRLLSIWYNHSNSQCGSFFFHLIWTAGVCSAVLMYITEYGYSHSEQLNKWQIRGKLDVLLQYLHLHTLLNGS